MRRWLLLLMVVICGAVCAYADPTEFVFVGWSGDQWQNGYPYYIRTFDNPTASIIAVMCDDYVHGGQPGEEWDANITQLGSGNIQLARFNKFVQGPTSLSALTLYDEAGWILLQTQVEPTNQWREMNYAAWNIFDPNSPCDSACEGWLAAAQQAARDRFPGSDFNRVYIITPVDQYDPDPHHIQEFLALGTDSGLLGQQGTTVPEPGTLVLMGSGLLALVGRRFLH